MTPNAVRLIAACVPGQRVTVILASGQEYALPLAPEPIPVVEPHPLEAVSKQLLERDAETRATVAAVVARVEDTVSAVKNVVERVAASQNEVTQGLTTIAEALASPVKPIYDKSGKLLGAQRVPLLK